MQFVGSITLLAETDRVLMHSMSALSVLFAVALFVRQRHALARSTRDGLVTPYDELAEADRVAP